MTEKLRDLMHERAAEPDFALPEIDSLVKAGGRRLRRRRASTAVAGMAVLAVAGGLVATQLSGDAGTTPVAVDPLPAGEVSWAIGSTIYTPSGSSDLGHTVRAYVRTADGYVIADAAGRVWSFTGGEVSEVGATDSAFPRLVSDPDGDVAGWVDPRGDRPAFVFLDQGTGEVTSDDEHTRAGMGRLSDEQDPAYLYALDEDTAYLRDTRGAVAVDLGSGDVTVLDAGAMNGSDVIDAESGQVAFRSEDEDGIVIGTDRAAAEAGSTIVSYDGAPGALSPDGRYLALDADEPVVYDVRTGEALPFDLSGFAAAYEWLDATTVVMISADLVAGPDGEETGPVSLVVCTVPSGSCEVVAAEIGTFVELEDTFSLPSGETLGS